jgi:hypothetical protein
MNYLCVIIDSKTKTTLQEYEIVVNNEPFAYWKAKQLYRNDPKFNPDIDWTVDCMQL